MNRVMLAAAVGCLGLSALAARAQEGGATTVSPLTVRPVPRPDTTFVVPDPDSARGHWASVWPQDAWRDGVAGHVVLSCDIDRYGLAERCAVAAETPADKGFGAAALQLRPTFKVTPARGAGGPVDSVMTIAVDFKPPPPTVDWGAASGAGPNAANKGVLANGGGADSPSFSGPPTLRDHRPVSILNNPIFTAAVSYQDLLAAYPPGGGGAAGYVVAHCRILPGGAVSDCQVVKEDPENHGFGRAATRLAERFRVAPQWSVAPRHADLYVDIPIRFAAPGAADDRTVTRPYWVAGIDAHRSVRIFPKLAAEQGLVTGLGVAECRVRRDGSLTDCAPGRADPEGYGFAAAAVELAPAMRMNPWLRDGEPADGATVQVPVRLNLKAAQ